MAKRTRWLIGIGVWLALLLGPATVDLVRVSIRQAQLDRQLARLHAEHERLLIRRERLQTDPTYVEGLIRTTFKRSRPGEYVIPMESPASSSQP